MAWTEESRRKALETKRLKGIYNQYTKAKTEGHTIVSPLKGKPNIKWKPHTEETKLIISKKARASNHRRLVKSTRYYLKKDGDIVLLDSSWEELLANRLDSLDIKWIRPEPIQWVDNVGKTHNYFPDFYLTEYDLYLDPKNPAAMLQQAKKIEVLKASVKNLIFLESVLAIETFCPCS